jgi:hypothetical protein
MSRKFIKGAIDMGLAQELTLAEAAKPLTAFRYMSFDGVGTMTDFESAIEDGLAVIAAEAAQFTKPDSLSLTDGVGERRRRYVLSGTALAY